MTLTIIFGAAVIIGVALIAWFCFGSTCPCWTVTLSTPLVIIAGVALIINLLIWLPSAKYSEVKYAQLLAEKRTIEAMLETGNDADRITLNALVIDYNNRIIWQKLNYNRPIYRDYFNHNFDWESLETIEWR